MSQYAKIVDNQNLIRDMYSKAVLTTDLSLVRQHEKRMMDLQKEEARAAEINMLKNDIAEIKELLKSLLNK